eukprot:TRINITY_DN603_c5_g1_i1.p1 TRINITY_DN603_c5_g1~~TRINITY_DN603_c5_g1_i1.p1  ORF type:complete len:274 (-),score=51.29 TRINITY_DN603_c5_g1_i1:74-895(-)
MINQGRLILAVATLLYAPVPLTEALDSGLIQKQQTWSVDKSYLQKVLTKSHLSLANALFPLISMEGRLGIGRLGDSGDIVSGRGDVSLFELLNEVSHFKVIDAFALMEQQQTDTALYAGLRKLPHFSSFGFKSFAYVDEIDAYFYLTKGRSLQAYDFTVKKADVALSPPRILYATKSYISKAEFPLTFKTSPLQNRPVVGTGNTTNHYYLSTEEVKYIQKYVSVVGLHHLREPEVFSACISFLQLFGLDVSEFTVDVNAAKCIYNYQDPSKKL